MRIGLDCRIKKIKEGKAYVFGFFEVLLRNLEEEYISGIKKEKRNDCF